MEMLLCFTYIWILLKYLNLSSNLVTQNFGFFFNYLLLEQNRNSKIPQMGGMGKHTTNNIQFSNVALLILSLPKMLLTFRLFCCQRHKYIGVDFHCFLFSFLPSFLKRYLNFKLILAEAEVSTLINFTFNAMHTSSFPPSFNEASLKEMSALL